MTEQNIWISDLMGMVQAQDADKIPANYASLLVNISLDKPGTWAKRKGSLMLDATYAGNGVDGLHNYEKNNGSDELRVIRNSLLQVYDEANDQWDASIGTGFGTDRVESCNYLRRAYHVGTGLKLSYENGSGSLTQAVDLKASCIAASPSTLFVANITELGGSSVDYQDRVYYSLYDVTNNTPSHQFYESDETLATSTRYFTVGSPVKAIRYYDSIGLLLVWTKKRCFSFDMLYAENGTGVLPKFTVGCLNHRAVTEHNSWLFWMDNKGKIWMWGGSGQPTEISFDIHDGSHKEAIINVIDSEEFPNVCAGSDGNNVYFSVGDLTYRGITYENCLLRGFLAPSGNVLWSVDTYPYKASIFANTEIDGKDALIMGCTDNNVYLLNASVYSDNGAAIDAFFRTGFMNMGKPVNVKTPTRILAKYRPQSVTTNYLYLKYAIDGKLSYSTITDPDAGTPVTRFGKINMYESDYATNLDEVKYVKMPNEAEYRTLSIEGGNSQLNEGFEITGLGVGISGMKDLDIRAD